MKIILETQKLNKIHGLNQDMHQHALKDIDLQIMQGEFISIMGPSGCGKSTLLHAISSMDKMTSGRVLFEVHDFSTMSEENLSALRLEKMGFIFQHNGLLKNLNILDNIVFPAYVRKQEARNIINERAFHLMQKTGIDALADKNITQVSGGQLQRAAICRALINQPNIVFGDEPTGALDSKSSAEAMNILREINNEGTTIILVTHDASVAAKSERILLMRDGAIAEERYLGKWKGSHDDLIKRESVLYHWLQSMN